MTEPFDTFCTDNPVCPYCGHEHVDMDDDVSLIQNYNCEECEREFTLWSEISVMYTTTKLEGA